MKKIIFITLLANYTLIAQQSSIDFRLDLGAFNSSINTQLINDNNKYLNEDDKASILSAFSQSNYIFVETDNSFRYEHSKGWSIGVAQRTSFNVTYPIDIIRLGLYGNTPFVGEQLSFTPFELDLFFYTDINIKYKWNDNLSTRASYLLGHQFADIMVNKASLNIGELGESIEYDLSIEANMSDTVFNNPFAINGHGVAVAICYEDKIKEMTYQISLSDIGFIQWKEDSYSLNVEDEFTFDGIYVDNILSFTDSIITNQIDRLEDKFKNSSKGAYRQNLPVRLNVNLSINTNSNVIEKIEAKLENRLNYYPKPRLTIALVKELKKHALTLGYHVGGFEENGPEFKYAFLGEKSEFYLYTKQANLFNPMKSYGVHAGIGIKVLFSKK